MSKVMKSVRRVHLYAGLALCPFVLLFGVTAFLFNHPTALRSDVLRHGAELTSGTVFDPVGVEGMAAEVVRALQCTDPGDDGRPRFAVGDQGLRAEFGRTGRILVEGAEHRHDLRLRDGQGGAFEVRSSIESEDAGERPEPVRVEIDRDLESEFVTAADEVARRAGLAGFQTKLERAPTIRFAILVDDVPHLAEFDPRSSKVTLRRELESEAPDWRRLLTRMHTAHGYPDEIDARFVWALLVDLVAFAMVGFGISGLAMWWQMKKLRRAGAVWTVGGVVVFAAMTVALRAAFAG